MVKQIISVSISPEAREYISQEGYKISSFIEMAVRLHKKWKKEIENLQLIAERIKHEDANKIRIRKFVGIYNKFRDKEIIHPALEKLIVEILKTEDKKGLEEALKEVNDKLHYTEYADGNPN